jgi:hypothetical protein
VSLLCLVGCDLTPRAPFPVKVVKKEFKAATLSGQIIQGYHTLYQLYDPGVEYAQGVMMIGLEFDL